ncbi:hypothetical protein CWO91_27940 [Bradyrhizobium genosp. SA-3]|uniref:hypothetical protein n=1 Tax=Bradyrhizobium genosp. SA-3 TaxID=508868 RepID=UPI001029CFD2|nr:hypothetical protein [Bradyrhizobium genosp. SA-3]RZN07308.1 hypothetical protein CWO91_27940 [Bradyrhizobium genosp. SA-3]
MMSFKEFMARRARPQVLVYYDYGDAQAAKNAAYLIEGGKIWDIDKKWSVRQDRTHHDPTTTHTHIRFKGNDYAILHRDGSPSHNMPADGVPNWVMDRIRKMGLIESTFIVEAAGGGAAVPAWVIERAELRAFINDTIGDYLGRFR